MRKAWLVVGLAAGAAVAASAQVAFERTVAVDIKPTSCPNPLQMDARGRRALPVAVLGQADFDVSRIDAASVRLAKVAPVRSALEDVAAPFKPAPGSTEPCGTDGPDGLVDMTFKFVAADVVKAIGDVRDGDTAVLTLTGALDDGTAIRGQDVVTILDKGPDRAKKPGKCKCPGDEKKPL